MAGGNELVASSRLRHIPALDGLRGAAVLAVVMFHLGHLSGGYLGVDLFFVLSGFLITSLLLDEGGRRGGIALGRFWGRRARRLFPALAILLVGVAVYARFAAAPEELHRIRWDGIATLFYVANWREIFGKADYWAMFTAPSPLGHSWSLAIEEQFYLVWPLVFLGLVAVAKRMRKTPRGNEARPDGLGAHDVPSTWDLATVSLGASLLLGILSLLSQGILQHLEGWNRVYFGTDTRAFAILVGAAVASWIGRCGPVEPGRRRALLEVVGIAGAGFLAIAWMFLDGGSRIAHHGGLPASSIAGALLIAAVVQPDIGVLGRVFSVAPLRWMGLISYGVYLYHWPLIVWMTPERVHLHGWLLATAQVATTLVVSVASFVIVEQPIRNRTGWIRRLPRRVPGPGYAALGAIALLGLMLSGTSARVAPEPEEMTKLDAAVLAARQRGGPRVMVVGNSVARFLALEGFHRLVANPPLTVLQFGRVGCSEPPAPKWRSVDGTVSSVLGKSCDTGWKRAVERFRPDFVIFARNALTTDSAWRKDHWVSGCSDEFRAWSRERFTADVRTWSSTGARVVLVTSLPSVEVWRSKPGPDYYETVNCGNQILRDVAEAHPREVTLVDLYAHYCNSGGQCRERLPDGALLLADGTHFRGEGARATARWILSQVGVETRAPG